MFRVMNPSPPVEMSPAATEAASKSSCDETPLVDVTNPAPS